MKNIDSKLMSLYSFVKLLRLILIKHNEKKKLFESARKKDIKKTKELLAILRKRVQ